MTTTFAPSAGGTGANSPRARRPRLLLDTNRVFSTAEDVAQRVVALDARDRSSAWAASPSRLFALANLVAFHVAQCHGAGPASRILVAQIRSVGRLVGTSGRADLAKLVFDPILNRIRLAAIEGSFDAAINAIDAHLEPSHPDEPEIEDESSLLFGSNLLAFARDAEFERMLLAEKLMILWRAGRLEAMAPGEADGIVRAYTGAAPALRAEIALRLRLRRGNAPVFRLESDDSLKRALHRGVVWIDAADPAPEGLLVDVLRRGLVSLDRMTFVCPSTPPLWATTTARWWRERGLPEAEQIDRVATIAEDRLRRLATVYLDGLIGLPAGGNPRRPLGLEVVELLEDALKGVA